MNLFYLCAEFLPKRLLCESNIQPTFLKLVYERAEKEHGWLLKNNVYSDGMNIYTEKETLRTLGITVDDDDYPDGDAVDILPEVFVEMFNRYINTEETLTKNKIKLISPEKVTL